MSVRSSLSMSDPTNPAEWLKQPVFANPLITNSDHRPLGLSGKSEGNAFCQSGLFQDKGFLGPGISRLEKPIHNGVKLPHLQPPEQRSHYQQHPLEPSCSRIQTPGGRLDQQKRSTHNHLTELGLPDRRNLPVHGRRQGIQKNLPSWPHPTIQLPKHHHLPGGLRADPCACPGEPRCNAQDSQRPPYAR
ncbi:unnamed protein product [Sphagnum tenellum]